jgi:hypothetical protein
VLNGTAEIPQLWGFRKDCLEIQRMILYPLFCGVKPRCFLSVFPSLLSITTPASASILLVPTNKVKIGFNNFVIFTK